MDRTQILIEAGRIVKDRGDQYGRADTLFTMIAQRWRLTVAQRHKVDLSLTAEDVALLMLDLKTARALAAPSHVDNYVDLAGYACLLGETNTGHLKPAAPKPTAPAPKIDDPITDIDDAMKQVAAKFGANAKKAQAE